VKGDRIARWQRVIEDSPLATAIFDRDHNVEVWNKAAERLFGWRADEVLGKPALPIIPPEAEAEAADSQRRVQAGETIEGLEGIRVHKNGTRIAVAVYAAAFGEALGGGIAVRFVNITERRRAEEISRDETNRQSLLADFLSASSDAHDQTELLNLLSERASAALNGTCSIYRLTPGERELEVVALSGNETERTELLRATLSRRRWRSDEGLMGRTIQTGETVIRPYLDADARAAYLASLAADRRDEMARIDLRAIISVPLTTAGQPIGVLALARYGESAEAFTERDRAFAEELAGRADIALARLALADQREREARQSRILAQFLEAVTEANGDENAILRRLAQAAADQMGDWCVIKLLSPDRQTLELRAISSRGSEPDPLAWESAGVPFYDPMDLDTIQHGSSVMGQVDPVALAASSNPGLGNAPQRDFGWFLTVPIRLREGVAGDILLLRETSSRPYDESDLGFVEDLSRRAALALERYRLERELHRTSELLSTILDSSPVAIWAVDENLKVTYWNPAAERLYGWAAGEVMGESPPFALADESGSFENSVSQVREGRTVEGEAQRVTKSGEPLEVRLLNAPIYDEERRFKGILGVHEDITERKRLEAELIQAQKMEVVGRLAGGVAHDFNNILTAIIGYSDIAHSMTGEPEMKRVLDTVRAAAQRAAGLTQQLLAFSRRQLLQPRILDANDVVLEMEPILQRLIGEDVDLVASVTPGVGSVLVDRTQLEQVILNLAVNARDAMPDGGRLVLRTENAHFDADQGGHLEMAPGDYVVISVTDTGVGMDEETKSHIFEPFFTTKEVGKGTGLGLATTYGIVRQSGGYIWVYSELGRGTTFKLYFPRSGGVTVPTIPVSHDSGARRGGRVLLVEDEPTLRELGLAVLSRSGFDVLAARDPATALRLAAGAGHLDLLVTDVVMPGSTGIELARQLRETRPDLPVLFMSGYSEDVTDVAGSMSRRFLAKPFTPEALLHAVDQAMGVDVLAGANGQVNGDAPGAAVPAPLDRPAGPRRPPDDDRNLRR
jgi:PAS domain S-box-containing protein